MERGIVSHEYLFMFSKSENYYFDQESIKERAADGKTQKNRRTVWAINTEPCKEAHFAVFPRALVRPCILAGAPVGGLVLDPFFGSGTVGVVAIETDRRCVGIEAKPEYVDIAKVRVGTATPPLFTTKSSSTSGVTSVESGFRQNSFWLPESMNHAVKQFQLKLCKVWNGGNQSLDALFRCHLGKRRLH